MAEFDERLDGTTCVLNVAGDIDMANADEFRDRLLNCLDRYEAVEVDMAGVSFIDSSGLGALVRLRTEAATRNKTAALRNLSAATDRLLEVSGLRELFTVKSTGS